MKRRPSMRDLEQADEMHRTARLYHAKAAVCLAMAANLLAGRPMAEGVGQDVHGLTDERQPATGEERPPARGG